LEWLEERPSQGDRGAGPLKLKCHDVYHSDGNCSAQRNHSHGLQPEIHIRGSTMRPCGSFSSDPSGTGLRRGEIQVPRQSWRTSARRRRSLGQALSVLDNLRVVSRMSHSAAVTSVAAHLFVAQRGHRIDLRAKYPTKTIAAAVDQAVETPPLPQ